MKFTFKRLQENMLNEDIAAVRKMYPKLTDGEFEYIVKRFDPTYKAGSDSVGKQVVAYWDTCRLLRLRIKLIAHLTHVVQIYLSAILVCHRLDGVVLLTLLTFERQVCHQS